MVVKNFISIEHPQQFTTICASSMTERKLELPILVVVESAVAQTRVWTEQQGIATDSGCVGQRVFGTGTFRKFCRGRPCALDHPAPAGSAWNTGLWLQRTGTNRLRQYSRRGEARTFHDPTSLTGAIISISHHTSVWQRWR